MACQHFPDDQTLRLQTGAGEDDIIHLLSGLDRVDCERQEEEQDVCVQLSYPLVLFYASVVYERFYDVWCGCSGVLQRCAGNSGTQNVFCQVGSVNALLVCMYIVTGVSRHATTDQGGTRESNPGLPFSSQTSHHKVNEAVHSRENIGVSANVFVFASPFLSVYCCTCMITFLSRKAIGLHKHIKYSQNKSETLCLPCHFSMINFLIGLYPGELLPENLLSCALSRYITQQNCRSSTRHQ